MDKVTAAQIRAEIAAAAPEQQALLKGVTDAIDALVADSKKLDSLLADVVKEKDELLRVKLAEEIKKMMIGLLGEDCSALGVTP